MHYLLGIDLGTSGLKTVLFDENGTRIVSKTKEYPLYQPENGWAEQKPEDWWDACIQTVQSVLATSQINPASISGIGISGQMHGLVMLDENNNVLCDAILWCDGRTSVECQEITDTIGKNRLIEISANPALTGFTAGKILWVRKHKPELYARCKHILLPKDYLRLKLTGIFATEVSDASGTNLLDVPARQWSTEILQALDIDPALLPLVHESFEVTGSVTAEAASLTGLSQGTPIVGGAGDNAAAAIGTGVVEARQAFTTIGTSGVIFAHSDTVAIDPKGRVHTFCSAVPNKWSVMSCSLAAGGSLQWFRNQFCEAEMQVAKALGKDVYELLTKEAEKIEIGANRLLFLPYLMGERSPLLDENARGVFFGLSGIHTRAHLLRAVMEGVVFSLRDSLDVFCEMGLSFSEMKATGGGGKSHLWREMMADIYNCPVATIHNDEGPALGVAILAGVGTGVYEDIPSACKKIIQTTGVREPIQTHSKQYEPYFKLYQQLYLSNKENFTQLSTLH